MDGFRHLAALLVVVTFPSVPLVWLVAHGFVGVWRRLGPWVAYPVLAAIGIGLAAVVYSVRRTLLSVEFGANGWLIAAAAICYLLTAVIEFSCWKHLSLRTLVGLPELAPGAKRQKLLREGIYSRVRHPRYLALTLGLLSVALFANYLAAYLLFPIFVQAMSVVIALEERELVERFGDEYREYQTTVPRLIPRWRG